MLPAQGSVSGEEQKVGGTPVVFQHLARLFEQTIAFIFHNAL